MATAPLQHLHASRITWLFTSTPLLLIVLLLITSAVYWPGLSGAFLFDDFPNIVTNAKVHAETLDLQALQRAAGGYEPGSIGRPLATITFAVDWYLGKDNPWGYKLTSLIVHLINALLVFLLMRSLTRLPRSQAANSQLLCFAVALLWAIHPLQISTVLYVVQRMESLSLMFVLIGLLAYVRGRVQQCNGQRGWHWLLTSSVLAGIGLLSKETAVLFPIYALAIELTLLRFDAVEQRTRQFLKIAYASLIGLGTAFFFMWLLPHYAAADAYNGRDFTLYERLLSQLRILPMYLGQILIPLPGTMPFYYDAFSKSTGWLSPATTLAGGLLLAAMFLCAWKLRTRLPLFSLGILWFFGAHLLTSNVITLELAFEHRNYFALLGILIALTDLVRRIPMRDGPALKHIAVAAIIVAVGFMAGIRAATWGEPLLLATEMTRESPASGRASNDLASLYIALSGGDTTHPFYNMGKQEFERGAALPNSSPLPEQGLILMAATTGQPVDDEWWSNLIRKVKTRPISPQEKLAVTGLLNQRYEGVVLDDNRLAEAYKALLARGPQPSFMYAQFGDYALTYLHDEALADEMFVTAINRDPTNVEYAHRILSTLVSDGHQRQAKLVYARAKALGLIKSAQH